MRSGIFRKCGTITSPISCRSTHGSPHVEDCRVTFRMSSLSSPVTVHFDMLDPLAASRSRSGDITNPQDTRTSSTEWLRILSLNSSGDRKWGCGAAHETGSRFIRFHSALQTPASAEVFFVRPSPGLSYLPLAEPGCADFPVVEAASSPTQRPTCKVPTNTGGRELTS